MHKGISALDIRDAEKVNQSQAGKEGARAELWEGHFGRGVARVKKCSEEGMCMQCINWPI